MLHFKKLSFCSGGNLSSWFEPIKFICDKDEALKWILLSWKVSTTQLVFACSKLTTKTLEQGVR